MPKESESDRSPIDQISQDLRPEDRKGKGDFVASFYESPWLEQLVGKMHHPGEERLIEEIGRRCKIDNSSEILDIGCGNGTTTIEISRSFGCAAVGLEISQDLIQEAMEKASSLDVENIDFQVTDGGIPAFPDGAFDFVLFISSFSLFENKSEILREVRRILRPGGTLVITNMVISEDMNLDIPDKMMFASCISGALPNGSISDLIENVGFNEVISVDWTHELRRQWATAFMRTRLKRKRGPFEDTNRAEGEEIREFLKMAEEIFESGYLGYYIFIGK